MAEALHMCVSFFTLTDLLCRTNEQVMLGTPGGWVRIQVHVAGAPGLHLVEPTLSWLSGSSLVPSWASCGLRSPL